MSDQTFIVGQEFGDAKSLRTAIKEAAISQHFELRTIKSDLVRYSAQCAADTCPWKIRAAKLSDSQSFTIRSFHGTHTCGQRAREGHSQASVDWLVGLIGDRLRDDINYKPREILRDVRTKYGITIPYKQAWRAKERCLEAIYGSSENGYFLLPSYCDRLKRTNPGSFAEVFTSNDGGETRFRSLFVAFHGSVYGFLNGCLPVIGLGSIRLKSKYLGTLLSASSFDGDGGFFPVAFGVVNGDKSDESWSWFLTELRKAFEEVKTKNLPQITFFSDGENGIDGAVKSEFPGSFHYYCVRYLSESIGRVFKNNRLVRLLLKAATSTTAVGFRESVSEIGEASSEASTWLSRFDPSRWALAFSPHGSTRFGQLSSNADELEKWLAEARDLPIIQVIETIAARLASEFGDRRSRSDPWARERLCPEAESRIRESVALGSGHRVLRSNESEFEVIVDPNLDSDRSHVVNLGDRSCSCRAWQFRGIPCSHAAAAVHSGRRDLYGFVEKCFWVESFRLAYSEEICPTRMGNGSEDMGQEDERVIRPPKVRRSAGRPEKKRVCLEDPNREKHTVRCSRCNQTGHYKTTCKVEVSDLSVK